MMKNTNEFIIKAYGRMELAMMYAPEIAPSSAYRKLCRWIDRCPGLKQKLKRIGYSPLTRQFTPLQVKMIVEHLGEP